MCDHRSIIFIPNLLGNVFPAHTLAWGQDLRRAQIGFQRIPKSAGVCLGRGRPVRFCHQVRSRRGAHKGIFHLYVTGQIQLHEPLPLCSSQAVLSVFCFLFFFFFPWLDLLAMKQQRFKRPLCCVIPLVGKTVFLKLGEQGNWHHVPLHTSHYLATVHFLIATNHGRLHVFLASMSLYSNVEA